MQGAFSVSLVVFGSGLIAVGCVVAEHAIDEDGELTGGGGDGLGLADACGESAVESSEGMVATGATHGGDAEGLGGAVVGGLGGRSEELATGDLVVGRESEP